MCQFKCKWLSEINTCSDLSNWKAYQDELYGIYRKMFIENVMFFDGKPIKVKVYPMFEKYETSFIHLICKQENINSIDPNDREPDLRRAERLHWIKEIIEKYPCLEKCIECEGLLLYKEYYKNRVRVKIFFPKERYIIILEDRCNYYLLITAFYIEETYEDKVIQKIYKRYNEYKKQGAPIP